MSGGGRSSGGRGSGGHSFGGRSGSGGRGGGGAHFGGFGSGRRSGGFYVGGPGLGRPGGGFRFGGFGFGGAGILWVIILAGIGLLWSAFDTGGGSRSIAKSTYRREPLPGSAVNETEYIRDDEKWLANPKTVRDSMRYFYRKTGVQPYLWIAENLKGSKDASWEEIEAAMEELYKDTFIDEGHLVILFYNPWNNSRMLLAGNFPARKKVPGTGKAGLRL